jgi:hypothetical protein
MYVQRAMTKRKNYSGDRVRMIRTDTSVARHFALCLTLAYCCCVRRSGQGVESKAVMYSDLALELILQTPSSPAPLPLIFTFTRYITNHFNLRTSAASHAAHHVQRFNTAYS